MKKLIYIAVLLLAVNVSWAGIELNPEYWQAIKVTNNATATLTAVPVLVTMDSLTPGVNCNDSLTDVIFIDADSTLLPFFRIENTDSFYVLPSAEIGSGVVDTIYAMFGYQYWGAELASPSAVAIYYNDFADDSFNVLPLATGFETSDSVFACPLNYRHYQIVKPDSGELGLIGNVVELPDGRYLACVSTKKYGDGSYNETGTNSVMAAYADSLTQEDWTEIDSLLGYDTGGGVGVGDPFFVVSGDSLYCYAAQDLAETVPADTTCIVVFAAALAGDAWMETANWTPAETLLTHSESAWDSGMVKKPVVYFNGTNYYLIYNGSCIYQDQQGVAESNVYEWQIGVAKGIAPRGPFTRLASAPWIVLDGSASAEDSSGMVPGDVFAYHDGVMVYYAGYNGSAGSAVGGMLLWCDSLEAAPVRYQLRDWANDDWTVAGGSPSDSNGIFWRPSGSLNYFEAAIAGEDCWFGLGQHQWVSYGAPGFVVRSQRKAVTPEGLAFYSYGALTPNQHDADTVWSRPNMYAEDGCLVVEPSNMAGHPFFLSNAAIVMLDTTVDKGFSLIMRCRASSIGVLENSFDVDTTNLYLGMGAGVLADSLASYSSGAAGVRVSPLDDIAWQIPGVKNGWSFVYRTALNRSLLPRADSANWGGSDALTNDQIKAIIQEWHQHELRVPTSLSQRIGIYRNGVTAGVNTTLMDSIEYRDVWGDSAQWRRDQLKQPWISVGKRGDGGGIGKLEIDWLLAVKAMDTEPTVELLTVHASASNDSVAFADTAAVLEDAYCRDDLQATTFSNPVFSIMGTFSSGQIANSMIAGDLSTTYPTMVFESVNLMLNSYSKTGTIVPIRAAAIGQDWYTNKYYNVYDDSSMSFNKRGSGVGFFGEMIDDTLWTDSVVGDTSLGRRVANDWPAQYSTATLDVTDLYQLMADTTIYGIFLCNDTTGNNIRGTFYSIDEVVTSRHPYFVRSGKYLEWQPPLYVLTLTLTPAEIKYPFKSSGAYHNTTPYGTTPYNSAGPYR